MSGGPGVLYEQVCIEEMYEKTNSESRYPGSHPGLERGGDSRNFVYGSDRVLCLVGSGDHPVGSLYIIGGAAWVRSLGLRIAMNVFPCPIGIL